MDVLLLSPYPDRLRAIVEATGDRATAHDGPIGPDDPDPSGFGLAVSYGYRHIVDAVTIDRWEPRLVNLHISMLPWNRGADPNFWAAAEGTPSGVSIHHIDAGIDTGDLIAQREVPFEAGDTLAGSYTRLHDEILDLFAEIWPALRAGDAPRRKQPAGGTVHRSRDKEGLMARLPLGWDTPVEDLRRLAREDSTA